MFFLKNKNSSTNTENNSKIHQPIVEENLKPIVEQIKENIDETGKLNDRFILPNPIRQNSTPRKCKVDDENKVNTSILNIYKLLSQRKEKEAEKAINDFAKEYYVYYLSEHITEILNKYEKELDMLALKTYAKSIIYTTNNNDLLDFALIIAQKITNPSKKFVESIKTLSLCTGIVLRTVKVISNWDNKNEIFFELAKVTDDWPKVTVIEELEPTTQEMKDWLLYEGYHLSYLPQYITIESFIKSEVAKRLKGPLTEKEYYAIGYILGSLSYPDLDKLSCLENYQEVVIDFLYKALDYNKINITLNCIESIKNFLEKETEDEELILACKNTINDLRKHHNY